MAKERYLSIPSEAFGNRFDSYLEYVQKDELEEYDKKLKSERFECTYCHKFVYNTEAEKTNSLCQVCHQKYLQGLLEPGAENKKITRFCGITPSFQPP